jgi:type IV pilus assembly protein PilC
MLNAWVRIKSLLGYTIPISVLAMFFEGMALMLRSGRSVADSILQASSYLDPELRQICADIAPVVRGGASLYTKLVPYAHRFPEIVMPILEVGEAAGGLPDAAKRLADNFQVANNVQRKFKYGVFSPWMLIVILVLLQFIGNIVSSIASKTTASIPSIALAVVMQTLTGAVVLVALYLAGRMIVRVLFRWEPLRLFVDTIAIALPRSGLVFRNLAAARWARSFATLWGAGVNISTALEIASRSALNAHYARAMRKAAIQTRQGKSLSQCLTETQLLPRQLLSCIAASEYAGRMEETLMTLATDLENEAYPRALEEMNRMVIAVQFLIIIIMVLHALGGLSAPT